MTTNTYTGKRFHGITAKEYVTLAQARDATVASEMLAFAQYRASQYASQGRKAKAERWQKVAATVAERLHSQAPQPVATFVTAPEPKAPRKAKAKADASPFTADEVALIKALAARLA